MQSLDPAVVAGFFGLFVIIASLVPWLAVQYRRRGTVGVGATIIAAGGVIYGLAIAAYTLLPLPSDTAALCTQGGAAAQLRLFAFVSDAQREGGLTGPASLLRNPAVAQFLLNVLLFIPLGMLVRHVLLRTRPLLGLIVGTGTGFAISLLVEFTQLTGDWYLYPCAYRLFDVDDVLANTVGALLGTLAAPLLRLVPGQRRTGPPGDIRPITVIRRFLGMISDVLAIGLTQAALALAAGIVTYAFAGRDASVTPLATTLISLVPTLALLIVVLRTGRTVGEIVVRIQPAHMPRIHQKLLRWALGAGGWSTLSALGGSIADLLAAALAIAAIVGVFATHDRRGFASTIARIPIQDDRAPAPSDDHGSRQVR